MNARIWKRAAGGPYKKTESEKYLKYLLQQYTFQGFTEERLSESFFPVCLCQSQGFSHWGCRDVAVASRVTAPARGSPELQF